VAQGRRQTSSAGDKTAKPDPVAVGPDGYPVEPDDPYGSTHLQINALLETVKSQRISENTRILT